MTTPICAVDCETDGVHPGRKPWEIALIRRDADGEFVQSFFVEIDLSTADPFGLKVGRFYGRHPRGRALVTNGVAFEPPKDSNLISPGEAALMVARMTHGAHLVGAVPNFDAEVFDRLLRAHGLCPGWHYHLIDIEALAVGWVAHKAKTIREQEPNVDLGPWPRLPWKSDDLGRAVGVEPLSEDERHTALGDARWALRVYDAVVGES